MERLRPASRFAGSEEEKAVMLPGDLLRQVQRHVEFPTEVKVYFVDNGDEQDSHRGLLVWKDQEVCAVPVGEVPERSVYVYECHRCGTRDTQPWVCRMGAPPPGIERRGLEFLAEPSNQGHTVFRRLVRRGADEILQVCRSFRDESGRPMVTR